MMNIAVGCFVAGLTFILFGANNFLVSLEQGKTLLFVSMIISVIFYVADLAVGKR